MTRLVIEAWWPLVALAVAVPLVVWFAMRSLSPLSGRHRFLLGAVRLLALACVAVALMRPSWLGQSTDVSVIYALDVSKSVPDAYGSFQFPASYLLDGEQKIRGKWVGAQDWQGEGVRKALSELAPTQPKR
jgi:hypothetical protein